MKNDRILFVATFMETAFPIPVGRSGNCGDVKSILSREPSVFITQDRVERDITGNGSMRTQHETKSQSRLQAEARSFLASVDNLLRLFSGPAVAGATKGEASKHNPALAAKWHPVKS